MHSFFFVACTREINYWFFFSLEERKKKFFVCCFFLSVLLKKTLDEFLSFCLDFAFIFYYAQESHSRQIVIVILLRVVGVVFIKKDDAAYDDVHCEDASSTPRW